MNLKGKYSLKSQLLEESSFTGRTRSGHGKAGEDEWAEKLGGSATGGSSHGHDVTVGDRGMESKRTSCGKKIQLHISYHPRQREIKAKVAEAGNKRAATIRKALMDLGIDEMQAYQDILDAYTAAKGNTFLTDQGEISSADLRPSTWSSLGGRINQFGPVYRFS